MSLAMPAADKGRCSVCEGKPPALGLDIKSTAQTRLSAAFFSFPDLINMCWVPTTRQALYQVLEMWDKRPAFKVLPA